MEINYISDKFRFDASLFKDSRSKFATLEPDQHLEGQRIQDRPCVQGPQDSQSILLFHLNQKQPSGKLSKDFQGGRQKSGFKP